MIIRSERQLHCPIRDNPFVGPTTYVIYEPKDYKQEAVPFRFKIGHRPPKIVCTPAPNQYEIKYRKYRILGGTSLRYTEERKTRKLDTTGPSPTTHRIFETRAKPKNNICRGRPPNYGCPITSLVGSYQIPDGNPDFKKKRISYYTRDPYPNDGSFHCNKYAGPRWGDSKSDTKRFKIEKSSLPGPLNYNTSKSGPTFQNIWDWDVRLENAKKEKLNRFVEKHFEDNKRDDLPGPFDTFVDFNVYKKKSFNVKGTFSKAERIKTPVCSDEPSPQSFDIKSTLGVKCFENRKHPPFNTTSNRPKEKSYPVGPADYNPMYDTISFKLCKKLPVISASFAAPFNNTEERSFPVCHIDHPSPLNYDSRPQNRIRFCEEPLGVMNSKTPRFPVDDKAYTPSPVHYAFNFNKKCDHAKVRYGFNTTTKRDFDIAEPEYWAAPNSYFADKEGVLKSTPRTIIARSVATSRICKKPTPGPADYAIHPLYGNAVIKAYLTHNVTFRQKDVFKTQSNKGPRIPRKVLRFFVRSPSTKKLQTTCP